MSHADFYKITLPLENNLFNELSSSVDFEPLGKGRVGNHLVKVENKGVPIVRTTSKYTIPAHTFSATHDMLAECINKGFANTTLRNPGTPRFNNALIEIYDAAYAKMNFHSDQSLDLAASSFIALFSCYSQPHHLSENNMRKLKIKDKATDEEFEILLTHNSVVLFSLTTNMQFLHKIVLDTESNAKSVAADSKWLGITFRSSKTIIEFKDSIPHFATGEVLELADEQQQNDFYKLRGQENNELNFVYPKLTYTLSTGDTLAPKHSR